MGLGPSVVGCVSWSQALWACWYGGLALQHRARAILEGHYSQPRLPQVWQFSSHNEGRGGASLAEAACQRGKVWAALGGFGSCWGCPLGVAAWELLWRWACRSRWIGQGKSVRECWAGWAQLAGSMESPRTGNIKHWVSYAEGGQEK